MKRVYKILMAALAAAMLLCSMAGCGGKPVPDGPGPGGTELPEQMQDENHGDKAARPGYEFDVAAADAATLEGLMSSFDAGTAVELDAGDELAVLTGGTDAAGTGPSPDAPEDILPEPVAAAAAPLPTVLSPEAPGTAASKNQDCTVDYSNIRDGYFMARWTGLKNKIKLQATGPSGVTYTYDLGHDQWTAFPLSDGNGHYDVRVMRNVGGTKYAVAGTASFDAAMTDEFAPFVRPNQYVDYERAENTLALAAELCAGKDGELDKVAAVYDWVVQNLSYDKAKAKSVQSGYLPDLDAVLEARKGICFDYAALMAGMLRSQGVACRLVVGYAGTAYHAWISVYVEGQGWVDGVIFFNGSSWQRMDPTYASSGKGSASIMKYIGDGSNYSARYLY